MALAATVTNKAVLPGFVIAAGNLTFSGNYSAGGESLNLNTVVTGVPTNKAPAFVQIEGKGGYKYEYDHANKKVMVRVNTGAAANAALPEHTAAAYAAGVSGDAPKFFAVIPR